MVKAVEFSYDDIAAVLSYDAEAGSFTWKVSAGTRVKAGGAAGTWLDMKGRRYLSITYRGRKMAAAQLAWLLHTKTWPDRNMVYIDDDPTNLRLSNLKMADHKTERFIKTDGSVGYKMTVEQVRHYGLGRNYGISYTQYAEMYAQQGGVCAVCGKPETHKLPGRKTEGADARVRDLSVDHDHETGAVRSLLCNSCNHMLGASGDNATTLRAAADYLDRHAAAASHVNQKDSPMAVSIKTYEGAAQ